jgi:two-component system chemotaxis sensor kinase CheA
MDSMMGIFYEESSRLVEELKRNFSEYIGKDIYGQELIQEIFRAVHTIKADATMMLFDGIAALSKKFERLLYCFRNGPKVIEDTERFDGVFCGYVDFVEQELDKIAQGEALSKNISEYVDNLKEQYELDESQITGKKTADKKEKAKRQIYYIPGAQVPVEKSDKEEKRVVKYENKDLNGVIVIKKSDLNKIQLNITKMGSVIKTLKKVSDRENYELVLPEINSLVEINKELSNVAKGFTKGDFTAVAEKMEILVDEMSAALNKNVRLLVKGEDIMIDKYKRDKISTALIHMIRNSVDHGIEDLETRERLGKTPVGLIKIKFQNENENIMITVEDDGAGINSGKVIEAAQKAGVLKKKPEEYKKEEIMELLLVNGISTTDIPNDYSGRGVGMDVINHSIKEIGGKLNITSEEGFGTKIEMEV